MDLAARGSLGAVYRLRCNATGETLGVAAQMDRRSHTSGDRRVSEGCRLARARTISYPVAARLFRAVYRAAAPCNQPS